MNLFQIIIIKFVRFYQRTAPTSLRQCCRFSPSCSEYMILAVEKYGATIGFFKGIKRILRCRKPNEGIDFP